MADTPYTETEALLAALADDEAALAARLAGLSRSELLALRAAGHVLLEAVDGRLHQ